MIFKLGAIATLSTLAVSVYALAPRSEVIVADPVRPALSSATAPRMIPARVLDCTLGRIANFDPSREQAASEFVFSGRHKFSLLLAATPIRTKAPPEATEPPEPVDPKTRIVSDPDELAGPKTGPFVRVVDLWPQRVEMTRPMSDAAVKLIVIDEVDERQTGATLFLTSANDAVTFDLKHLYYGRCTVKIAK